MSSPAIACKPAIVLPSHVLTREDVVKTVEDILGADFPHLGRILKIVRNAGIEKRYLVRPLNDTITPAGFGATNALFAEVSKDLCVKAARAALDNAKLEPKDIDLIITTSCTGIMIPSVDAFIIPALGFDRKTKRLPITELGCAAGAVSFSRAREFIEAYPGKNVLVVSHEFCSLTYQRQDFTMQALVGAMLFGDGVSACVIRGDGKHEGPGLRLDNNGSYLFEDSWGYMGFDIRDTGMHLILDKDIPGAVERQIAPVLSGFLTENSVPKADVDFFCVHPGGKKVLDEIARVFELTNNELKASHDCLAEVGNLSSASIFVVLKNIFERYAPKHGDTGLLTAFGPGFSCEMSLCTWVES